MTDEGGAWAAWALELLDADDKAAPPHVIEWPGALPAGSRILLFDESTRPTGSLKHATMRLIFRRLVTDRAIRSGCPVVMASAGNAAVAGAYWCRMLGLECAVVVPERTSLVKAERIEAEGARVVFHTPPAAIYEEAQRIAQATGGFYLDHFAHGPQAATEPDWPLGVNLFEKISTITGGPPTTVIAGLGSGSTVAGLHAYTSDQDFDCRIVGVDAENSAYLRGWLYDVAGYGTGMPTRIEGIGRPVLPDSFNPDSIELIVQAPDAASIAGARQLRTLVDKPIGASSGANLWAALRCARNANRPEIIATFIADAHPHYLSSCHDDSWCASKQLDPEEFADYFQPEG